MIASDLEKTLVHVADALSDARAPWWIIGSAAMALHGVDPGEVADVDVLMGAADARALIGRLGLENAPRPDKMFRSEVFARWEEPPLAVDFMGDFAVRQGAGWSAVEPVTRQHVPVGSNSVAVPALIELRHLFERFGREKDRARIRLLDEAGRGPGR